MLLEVNAWMWTGKEDIVVPSSLFSTLHAYFFPSFILYTKSNTLSGSNRVACLFCLELFVLHISSGFSFNLVNAREKWLKFVVSIASAVFSLVATVITCTLYE